MSIPPEIVALRAAQKRAKADRAALLQQRRTLKRLNVLLTHAREFCLHGSAPASMCHDAQVIIGYAEAFPFYAAKQFPWQYVLRKLTALRAASMRHARSRLIAA